MGTYTFKLPDVGEGIAEAEIVEWHADVGDRVEEDQPLVDVMTEKATVEIGAPVSGTILSRNGGVGDMAAVGAELVVIATADAEAPPPSTSTATTMPATSSARPNETIERASRGVRRDRERSPRPHRPCAHGLTLWVSISRAWREAAKRGESCMRTSTRCCFAAGAGSRARR